MALIRATLPPPRTFTTIYQQDVTKWPTLFDYDTAMVLLSQDTAPVAPAAESNDKKAGPFGAESQVTVTDVSNAGQ